MGLAEWMAGYYLAPLGEVLRGMLPLMAEVRRTVYYRITDLDGMCWRSGWKGNPIPGSQIETWGTRCSFQEGPRDEAAGEVVAGRDRSGTAGCWRGWLRVRR